LGGVRGSEADDLAERLQPERQHAAGDPESGPSANKEPGGQRRTDRVPDDRRRRGPTDAEAGERPPAEDEERIEQDVQPHRHGVQVERPARVPGPDEDGLHRVRDEDGRQPDGVRGQVRAGEVGDRRVRPERRDHRARRYCRHPAGDEADGEGETESVDRAPARAPAVASPGPLRDDDLRADHGDQQEPEQDAEHRDHQADAGDRGLAQPPEPEEVDHLVHDLDEVLRHEREREKGQ
jgi:hypothetical protein